MSFVRRILLWVAGLTVTLSFFALPAKAQLVLQTVAQGSYSFNSGYPLTPALHQPTLSSLYRSAASAAERNLNSGYLTFSLPKFSGTLTQATLELDYSGASQVGGTGVIKLRAWDVATPLAQLTSGPFGIPVPSTPAFDLQAGESYGSADAEPGVFEMKTLVLELNSAFLQLANSAHGGAVIAFGLALDPPTGLNEQAIQFLSVQPGDAHFQLRLETTGDFTPVPEVSSFTLCGVTMLVACALRRRRLWVAT